MRPSKALRQRLEHAALAGSHRYVAELRALFRALHKAVMADLRPFLSLYSGRRQDGLSDLTSRIGHFIAQVPGKVAPAFRRMVGALVRANRAVMTELLGRAPAEPTPSVLEDALNESVRLVSKVATAYAEDIRATLERGRGQTQEDLEASLDARGEVWEAHAGFVARDQTLKLNAKLTREAQENAGYEKYWWLTCRDDRVRPTHRTNDGVIFAWSDPSPITGHPGDDPNCRCQPIPYDGPGEPGERA